jgi:hypothetical protein
MRSDDTALTEPRPAAPTEPGAAAVPGAGPWFPPGAVIMVIALVALGFGLSASSGLWHHPDARMMAGNIPDATHYLWWLGHTPHAIWNGQNPFETLDLNWAEGVSAMNNTTLLLPAVLLSPVSWLAGSLVSLNALNALAVPACAAGGYWALRQVPWDSPATGQQTGQRISRSAALVGGVAFGISPAIVNSLVGHITMAFAPGLPILIGLSVRAWYGSRPVRDGVLLGLAATAQVFTGEEVLFQAVLGAVLVLVISALSRPKPVIAAAGRLTRSLVVAFAVFLPITGYPLYLQFFGPLKEHGSPFLLDFFGADVTAFTTPTDRVWLHSATQAAASAKFAGGLEEHLAYLGWPLLITCLLTALFGWRRVPVRCAAAGLLLAMALSLGGRLWVKGVWTEHAGPYRLFQKLPVTEASLATRFGLLAALFAAALLAFAVQMLRVRFSNRLVGALLGAGLAAACLAPLLPRPMDVVPVPATPQYFTSTARQLPTGSVLLVLPYPVGTNPVAMRWQAQAHYAFRMPGGYFLGPGGDGHAYVGGSADPPTANLLGDVARTGQVPVVTAEMQAQAARDFAAWGATEVVLGPDPMDEPLLETVTALLGRQPTHVDGVVTWATGAGG